MSDLQFPKSTVKEQDQEWIESENQQEITDFPAKSLPIKVAPEPSAYKTGGFQILLVTLMALGVGFVGGQWWQATPENRDNPTSEKASKPRGNAVKIAAVETFDFEETSDFVGTLEAKRAVDIKPEIEGRITQILVESGQVIEQGDAIARLKSDSVESSLNQAKANLVRTQARLSELQAGSRPEEIAQGRAKLAEAKARLADAESGSLLAEINQAKSQIDSIQADAELAQNRVNRFQDLSESGAISQDQFDALSSQRNSANANLQAAKRRLEQLQKNRQSEINLRQAVIEQEQQALNQLESGTRIQEIQQAEAQVAEAVAQVRNIELDLQETAVLAPFTGVVGDVGIKVGDYVSKGDILTRLTANDQLELRLPIALERKEDLKLGLSVQMVDPQGKILGTGRISFISPSVNQDSQTILAKASFDNSQGLFKDGQFVRAEVVWKQKLNAVVIPMTAVKFEGDQRFVFIAEGEEKLTAKKQTIKLGLIQNDRAEILEGLKPGQKLIISGTQKLSDGAAINILPANSDQTSKGKR
ncbi:Efflux transporter, RND/HAE family, Membrane Fusion Protein subunit [Planktothrix sp. PCC 11201]|uniref:efflux RND transporter periplasmic adaptor subunit n=1 Tax=Planktothrix sp. PCC 11201 TaxID=1729650 RepID=UPI00091781BC|nr:efflux RND transporter periplasmic adaptor subunit [Planktothrix sp. PCC 11201]SKB13035.1 Efflux transporter, RND/HAE family, Membrane Fusion Protein subunit [Planktothrix sp. PCC 11201]